MFLGKGIKDNSFNRIVPMQSVPISTEVVTSNPAQARCTRYNII